MPSADDLIGDFDDFQETQPNPQPETLPTPIPTKKGKKKSKKNASAKAAKWQEDDYAPYPSSITPSPPVNHGVKLEPAPAPPPKPAIETSPELEPFVDEPVDDQLTAWDEDTTVAEEPEPPPKPTAAQSPAVRSPRLMVAKPAAAGASPPYRPASLHAAESHQGDASHRFSKSIVQPPQLPQESLAASHQTSPRPRYAQPSSQPRFADPPPPHMPQPHFYGLPDFGLNLAQKQEIGKPAGSNGYCCCFDSFADAGDSASAKKARDCLLVGSEDGLEVYRVLPDKMEVVGRLEGLRGAVIEAKILPHIERHDALQPVRPLVAVILHGPVTSSAPESTTRGLAADTILYQTTVEVYSLRSQKHVVTLFQSSFVHGEKSTTGQIPAARPEPVGELGLRASGGFLAVASGKSGEVFVFSIGSEVEEFRCVGKFWTSLQRRQESARPTSSNDSSTAPAEPEAQPGVPLVSLRGRWLAVVPPYTSAGTALQCSPLLHEGVQPAGLNTVSAPLQPPITCEVAGVDAEGALSWLSRKAAQGLVKASQRGFEMGMNGWKELTHPSPPSTQTSHQRSSSYEPSQFPPTNAPANDPKRLDKEPALVSVFDLQKLVNVEPLKLKQASLPLATFALVEGCNHLSISPDGLRLMTSNRKGEVMTIWDLASSAHGSMKESMDQELEMEQVPHIKQLHRIPRSSPSTVVESMWSKEGDWVAILTTHGTVHLHEVPLTASGRKRKRRGTINVSTPDKAEATVSMSQGMSPPSSNGLLGSFRSWSQSVSTQANALKTQYALPTTFAGFRETAAAASYAGRKAVAKGLGQGYSAAKSGASDIWHAEDNKIRVKAFQEGTRAGCLTWIQRQSGSALAVVGGGNVTLHPVERVVRRKGDAMVSGLKRDKHVKTFALLRLDASKDGKTRSCSQEGPHGFWTLRHPPADEALGARKAVAVTAPSSSEVETNPPYCPFHIDRRVNIYTFDEFGSQVGGDPTLDFKTRGHGYLDHEDPWLFGESLPSSTKVNEHPQHDELDVFDDGDMAAQVESKLFIEPAGQGRGEQIRVSSRRSHGQDRMDEEELQMPEDDEDDDSMM